MVQQFVNRKVYFHCMQEKSLIMCSDKDAGSRRSFKPSFSVVLSSYFSRNCSSSNSFHISSLVNQCNEM